MGSILCGLQWIQLRKSVETSLDAADTECPRHDLCGLFSNSKLGVVFHEVVGDHVAHDHVRIFDTTHVRHWHLNSKLG